MKLFPKEFMAAFGMTGSLADPGIFFTTYIGSFLWPVVGAIAAIVLATRPTAADAERGWADLSLATPLTRWRYLGAAILGQLLVLGALALVTVAGRARRGHARRGRVRCLAVPRRRRRPVAVRVRHRRGDLAGRGGHAQPRCRRRGLGRDPHHHVPAQHRRPGPAQTSTGSADLSAFRYTAVGQLIDRGTIDWIGIGVFAIVAIGRLGRLARALPPARPAALSRLPFALRARRRLTDAAGAPYTPHSRPSQPGGSFAPIRGRHITPAEHPPGDPCTQSSRPAGSSTTSKSERSWPSSSSTSSPARRSPSTASCWSRTGTRRPSVDRWSPAPCVSATVLRADRADKVISFKYKPKARRRVKKGHRQEQTILRITDVTLNGKSAAETEKVAAEARKTERERLAEAAATQAATDAALAATLADEGRRGRGRRGG